MPPEFTPILYVKNGCPSCFKLRLFLLEAGLADRFAMQEFTAGDGLEAVMKAELSSHFDKVTFPTVQFAPGQYQNESDDIVARYAGEHGIDPAGLPLFAAYGKNLLPRLRRLNRENKDMKARLGLA